jgi:hypothetical protein
LGTFNWEPLLGTLGTFTWEPLLGNLYLEPGNLGGMGFGAAPVCSETFTMAEDPKASAVGEKYMFHIVTHCSCNFSSGVLVENLGNLYNVILGNLRHLPCTLGKLEETLTM